MIFSLLKENDIGNKTNTTGLKQTKGLHLQNLHSTVKSLEYKQLKLVTAKHKLKT